jgi:hypothetical protein
MFYNVIRKSVKSVLIYRIQVMFWKDQHKFNDVNPLPNLNLLISEIMRDGQNNLMLSITVHSKII